MSGQPSDQNKFASLSSGLLARKGDARPAMRRASVALPTHDHAEDDLGWNDFGSDDSIQKASELKRQQQAIAQQLGADIASEEPTSKSDAEIDDADMGDAEAAIRPVLRDMKIKARRRGRARPHGSAAFTLRLDAERHLRLRLACAVHDVSAQKLVTEALDAMFDSMPELEPLAERVASR